MNHVVSPALELLLCVRIDFTFGSSPDHEGGWPDVTRTRTGCAFPLIEEHIDGSAMRRSFLVAFAVGVVVFVALLALMAG